jgi:hypothetical protein
MGLSIVLVVLIVEGAILWWMTKFSGFKFLLWAVCCAAYWPSVLSMRREYGEIFPWLVFGGLVWTLVPVVGWALRRRNLER